MTVPTGGSLLYPQRMQRQRQPMGGLAKTRVVRRRLIQDGERTYRAYSADELIELDSLARHGRPGHLW